MSLFVIFETTFNLNYVHLIQLYSCARNILNKIDYIYVPFLFFSSKKFMNSCLYTNCVEKRDLCSL